MQYVISPTVLENSVQRAPDGNGEMTVTMKAHQFDLLIELLYRNSGFDEAAYLRAYPDIAAAVKNRQIDSGLSHYLTTGWHEQRRSVMPQVDQNWYARKYPDVALAIRSGKMPSAQAHFELAGHREGRAPNAAVNAFLEKWRQG